MSALFWNKEFKNIEQKVSIELEVNKKDLDLDHTQSQDMNVIDVPNHIDILVVKRNVD